MRLVNIDALKFTTVAEVNGILTHVLTAEDIDNAPIVEPEVYMNDKDYNLYLEGYKQGKKDFERLQGEWIPVSERLPNRNGVYNVTRKLNEGETIYFISDASYFDGQNIWHSDNRVNHGRPYLTDIIAWQSLPEPYKEGGADTKIKNISPDSGIREFDKKFADLIVFNDQPQRQLKSSDTHEDV